MTIQEQIEARAERCREAATDLRWEAEKQSEVATFLDEIAADIEPKGDESFAMDIRKAIGVNVGDNATMVRLVWELAADKARLLQFRDDIVDTLFCEGLSDEVVIARVKELMAIDAQYRADGAGQALSRIKDRIIEAGWYSGHSHNDIAAAVGAVVECAKGAHGKKTDHIVPDPVPARRAFPHIGAEPADMSDRGEVDAARARVSQATRDGDIAKARRDLDGGG